MTDTCPSSLVTGCSPVCKSIMASLRIPSATPVATIKPSESGPRCVMRSHIERNSPRAPSAGSTRASRLAHPVIPHIRTEGRRQKAVGRKKAALCAAFCLLPSTFCFFKPDHFSHRVDSLRLRFVIGAYKHLGQKSHQDKLYADGEQDYR